MEYNKLKTKESIDRTIKALQENGFEGLFVENGGQALAKIKELISKNASVMNGSSRTLEEIGFVDYLKTGDHGWRNLHAEILAEKDPAKQALLRKQSVTSDFYLGSVHALSETGEAIIASNSGSQLPYVAFTSPNVIFVVGAQKIVPTLTEALNRLDDYVVPLEDARVKPIYGTGTMIAKILILKKENQKMGRKVRFIIVNEVLGY